MENSLIQQTLYSHYNLRLRVIQMNDSLWPAFMMMWFHLIFNFDRIASFHNNIHAVFIVSFFPYFSVAIIKYIWRRFYFSKRQQNLLSYFNWKYICFAIFICKYKNDARICQMEFYFSHCKNTHMNCSTHQFPL